MRSCHLLGNRVYSGYEIEVNSGLVFDVGIQCSRTRVLDGRSKTIHVARRNYIHLNIDCSTLFWCRSWFVVREKVDIRCNRAGSLKYSLWVSRPTGARKSFLHRGLIASLLETIARLAEQSNAKAV
jgi:hypothetical protein